MHLIDQVLAGRVFEVNVSRLPLLQPMFEEYEKAREFFVPGIKMSDYDRSCAQQFEDSIDATGSFDKARCVSPPATLTPSPPTIAFPRDQKLTDRHDHMVEK